MSCFYQDIVLIFTLSLRGKYRQAVYINKLLTGMINETVINNHEAYIKDGDGTTVYINRKGMQMFRDFLAKKGGVTGVQRITHISRPTLTKFRDESTCAPETWEAIFNAMNAA